MEREGNYSEQTYRNNFHKDFDFLKFNMELVKDHCSDNLIIGFDPSFVCKSEKHTPEIGYFYSGVAKGYKRGLEIGGIAIVDLEQQTSLRKYSDPRSNKNKRR
jgi:hypothetical protein